MPPITRSAFLKRCGAGAAGALLGGWAMAADEPVRLKSWELAEIASLPGRRKQVMKVTASNGAFGISRPVGNCTDLRVAHAAAAQANLLDHEALYDLMAAKSVPKAQMATLDIACWDLHARMAGKPLHALLGTKKTKILRYGDVRGHQPDFSPERYARSVATYFDRTGLKATKLHFPGNMHTKESISLADVLATLEAVRKAVGDDRILAWDPYPGSAESATASLDEAKQIVKLMDDLGYTWIEGPLVPVPYETQIPKYAELLPTTKLRIQAEGPRSPIGDGTSFADMKRWVEADAVNQCSSDAYIAGGLTNALRMLEYARTHPEKKLVINLHWAWAPHAHLVMAYDERVCPIAEFPMVEEVPKDCLDGPFLKAPDWPGIYRIG